MFSLTEGMNENSEAVLSLQVFVVRFRMHQFESKGRSYFSHDRGCSCPLNLQNEAMRPRPCIDLELLFEQWDSPSDHIHT